MTGAAPGVDVADVDDVGPVGAGELARLAAPFGGCDDEELAALYAQAASVALARGDKLLGPSWAHTRRLAARALASRVDLVAVEFAMRVRFGASNALSKRFQICAALLETWTPTSARVFRARGRRTVLLDLAVRCVTVPFVWLRGRRALRQLERGLVRP